MSSLIDTLTGSGEALSGPPDEIAELASIARSVRRIFNTRKGSVRHLPDFGLSEQTEFYSEGEGLGKLRAEMESVLTKYEPRLRRVRVEHVATRPFRADFVVQGRLGRREIRLSASVSSGEETRVEPASSDQ